MLLLTGALLLGALEPATSQNNRPVRGQAVLSAEGGYARLVIKLDEDVDSEVLLAGSVMVIRFKRPVDVPVDKIADAVPDYVGSARRDPDGSAIRLALQRKVTVNSMTAGERLYVDLMPDGWKGSPPGLPQEVLKELSDRARAAERALRQQRATMAAKARTPIRVRAAVQPTFVRFVFEMPDGVGVNSTLSDQKLSLLFTAPLTFDLADAKLAAPPNISGITQKLDSERSSIDIGLIGNVDVHSFREEKNYIVDIGFQQPEQPRDIPAAISKLINGQGNSQANGQAPNARPAEPAREIVPPTSEALAQQIKGEGAAPESKPPAKTESKPEPKAETKPELKPIAPVEAKAEPKTEAKTEPKPEVKAEVKPEAKADQPPPAAPSVASELAMAPPSKPETTAPAVTAPAASEPAVAAPEPKSAAPAAASAAKPGIAVEIGRSPDGLRLGFPFGSSVPAALFRRADSVWLVFDSNTPIDLDPVRRQGGANIAEIKGVPMPTGQAVQIRMSRPQLASLTGDAQGWAVVFADVQKTPSQPLQLTRDISNPTQASLKVALPGAGAVHRLSDPEAGDTL
ncbi:tetratricopeptide repeat protein, partial [Rhodopseudomonas pseudopalustris]